MTPHLSEKILPLKEQRFLLPGHHSWEQFEAIEALMAHVPALRISYLDGWIEFITNSSEHETIKTNLCSLLETYLFNKGTSFIHQSRTNIREKNKSVSFEIEESYDIGKKKELPDIAIEVVMLRSNIDQLEKYKRFKIIEVWFWEDNQLSLHRLRDQKYEQISRSEFLPELEIDLLTRCVRMPSRLEARTEFLQEIRRQR
ncbi:Uma2 family endonuclease [Microcoleus sp. FACHB-672]|uniref:Uma2 family endonuclease n=1 Tax=Microcoleus sp. FACHB-672 TaxID=2692825 RepID=UPI001687F11F|nr:Uma2 family endonuclease [Microcoleus sp. FACHB-672]MBD2043144.1 Uma2 family endonuclease [Microcoleus sp. FACHB-672]